jgi:predicted nucleic acid-binding protein
MGSPPSEKSAKSSIASKYVIDANIAIDAFVPEVLFTPTKDRRDYESSLAFLTRAVHHGAELIVPNLFFGEVANAISRYGVATGLISSEDGAALVQTIFSSVQWRTHLPDYDRVFAITKALQRKKTGDSEYLALAGTMSCAVITGDGNLERAVNQSKLGIRVIRVNDHPWAQDGPVDADPPND